MTDDPAEKLLCKLLIHNKVLEKAEIKKVLLNRENWDGATLPEHLLKSGTIKQSVHDKAIKFVESKGESFAAVVVEESEEEPLELDVIDEIGDGLAIQESEEPAMLSDDHDDSAILPNEYEEPEVDTNAVTSEPEVSSAITESDESLIPSNICEPRGEGKKLITLLMKAREDDCSDLHISPETPAFVRKNGDITRVDEKTLSPSDCEAMLFDCLTEFQKEKLKNELQLDFSLELPDGGRFRSNIVRQRTGWTGCFRIVAKEPPSIESMNLPKQIKQLTEYPTGLVLITGPMGSGKTTTLAAMIDMINEKRKDHIITLEDPIEFRQHGKNCQVSQRSLGTHTLSYANALKGALRQDPDVILVGELRDLETISIAITAAETGHLVLASLHTKSADRTIDRIVGVFPPDQQAQIRVMVAESFRGIVCQQLVPKADGSGRALAIEVLMSNTGVRKMIVDNRTYMLDSAMQTGKKQGMIRMDDSIEQLYSDKVITKEVAKLFHRNPNKIN